MNSTTITIKGEELVLLPERAVYWPSKSIIIVSDLHLGKAGHFRKHGIPISRNIHLTDLQILESLIRKYLPNKVILLGDLFHSYENNEWKDFLKFLAVYDTIEYVLIEGNHDILDDYPPLLNLTPLLEISPFSFTHIREKSQLYNLSGHLHPGIFIRGKGRQSITLPCFYFAENHGLLPAFGQFTGIKKIRPKKEDRVFGIAEGRVVELT